MNSIERKFMKRRQSTTECVSYSSENQRFLWNINFGFWSDLSKLLFTVLVPDKLRQDIRTRRFSFLTKDQSNRRNVFSTLCVCVEKKNSVPYHYFLVCLCATVFLGVDSLIYHTVTWNPRTLCSCSWCSSCNWSIWAARSCDRTLTKTIARRKETVKQK